MDKTVGIMLREKIASESQICFFLSFFISVMLIKRTNMKGGSVNVIRMITELSMEFNVPWTLKKKEV